MALKIKKLLLFLGDVFTLYLAMTFALQIRYGADFNYQLWKTHFLPFSIIYALWLVVFYIIGLYDLKTAANNLNFYTRLFKALAVSTALAAIFFYFLPLYQITPKRILVYNAAAFALIFAGWRHLFNRFLRSPTLSHNILIIGANKEVGDLISALSQRPQLGYKITAMIDLATAAPDIHQPAFQNIKVARSIADIPEIVRENSVKTIVSAVDPRENPRLLSALYECLPYKINFSDLADFYETIIGKTPLSIIGEVWFLDNLMRNEKQIFDASKRVFDVVGAAVLGTASLLLYFFIAPAIKIDSRGPVLYSQKRVGKDGKVFSMVKFRTMVRDAEKDGIQWAQKTDLRVTRVGRFLRRTRLDELPQLWNVFLGQMSFVGPRPERPEFVELLAAEIPFYQMRHLVKPGLSGWAQINFPYGASVSDAMEKLQYDLYYVKNRSFILDIGIVLKTINIILKREGV